MPPDFSQIIFTVLGMLIAVLNMSRSSKSTQTLPFQPSVVKLSTSVLSELLQVSTVPSPSPDLNLNQYSALPFLTIRFSLQPMLKLLKGTLKDK